MAAQRAQKAADFIQGLEVQTYGSDSKASQGEVQKAA